MQNKSQSQPNLLRRIYRNPIEDQQSASQLPDLRIPNNKILVPKLSKKKTEQAQGQIKLDKPIKLGGYSLEGPKYHNYAALILSERADETLVQHVIPKHIDLKNISFNFNPNAETSVTQNIKKEDIMPEKKIKVNPPKKNQPGRGKKDKNFDVDEEEEYLTPFDFITLLRSDPDMADEFCYLNKREDPYDWQIVDFDKRNPKEYMTISSRGITHFIDDEATFLTIEEWEREVSMYRRLKEIWFFKNYKTWKNFTLWKRLNRKNVMRDRAQLLTQDLFTLDNQNRLCQSILIIRRLCITEVYKTQLFLTSFTEAVDEKSFVAAQDSHRQAKLGYLIKVEEEIKKLLQKSCANSMQVFKDSNRISNRNDTLTGEEPAPLLVGDETNKEMPYTQEATIRTHQKKLRRYIKLVDYLMLDSKINMIINSLELLYLDIKQYNDSYEESLNVAYNARKIKAGLPIFLIDLFFEGTDVTYSPSRHDIRSMITDTITKTINLVCSKHKQYLHDSVFSEYAKTNDLLEDPTDENINMLPIIKNDPNHKRYVDLILNEIDKAFNYAERSGEDVKPLLEIYQRNTHLDIEIYRDKETDEIKAAIHRFDAEKEKLNELENRSEVGIVSLEKKDLRERIVNCASICREKLEQLLPRVNCERAEDLIKQIQQINDSIKVFPDNVDDFVKFMKNLAYASSQRDNLSTKYNTISQTKDLIDEFHLKIKDERFKSKPLEALQEYKKILEKITTSDDSMNQNLNKFRKDLEREVSLVDPKLRELSSKLNDPRYSDKSSLSELEDVVSEIQVIAAETTKLVANTKKYIEYQSDMQMEQSSFEKVDDLVQEMKTYQKLWTGIKAWKDNSEVWRATQFEKVPIDDIVELHEKLTRASIEAAKKLEMNEVAKQFKMEMEQFKNTLELITCLKEPALAPHHWDDIRVILETASNVPESLYTKRDDPALTLETIINLRLEAYLPKIQDVSIRAIKERELDKMLQGPIQFWGQSKLQLKQYKQDPNTPSKFFFILEANEELVTRLDEALVTISNILSNRYVERMRKRVEKEQKYLDALRTFLDECFKCQRSWIYLESIFSSISNDMKKKELPSETKDFGKANTKFTNITGICEKKCGDLKSLVENEIFMIGKDGEKKEVPVEKPVVVVEKNVPLTEKEKEKREKEKEREKESKPDFISQLQFAIEKLERAQKGLIQFLDKTRSEFPRFYFLSNDELLDIVSSSKDIKKVEPHLRKCFEAITKLDYEVNEDGVPLAIKGIISPEGENVELKGGGISISQSNVQALLSALEEAMILKLKDLMRIANTEFDENKIPRKEWIKRHKCQVVITVEAIAWATTTQQFLTGDIDELQSYCDIYKTYLEEYITIIRGQLDDIERRKVVALVTQVVHFRDILEWLIKENVESPSDFKWQQQLRYGKEEGAVIAQQVNSKLNYGYEYLGALTRLVITPLTDRCWMTITGALHIKYGAAPAGPAGTGKTESTKDLAKGLARLCIVFNCSDQVTVTMISALFAGLCTADAWACLDEFNRIKVDVLSVIAQQVLQIRNALLIDNKGEKFYFQFEGRNIELRRNMGIFITMNPGYAGRTELPDNLKVLFRPVAMMVPDYSLIAEIMLMAEGFSTAKGLSVKMAKLYKLASEQLSQQDHYDFGMRAVKSVLVMAGALKRAEPNVPEDVVLIRAMRDSNIPKFLSHDIPLFNAIIIDLFPEAVVPPSENVDLVQEIKNQITTTKLQIVDTFVEKVVQLHETLKVRFGVMIVGPTMAGKSSIMHTLRRSYISLGEKRLKDKLPEHLDFRNIDLTILNPKAIKMEELFGKFDNMTQEWTDGLASNYMRLYSSRESSEKRWVMFDGPVDSLWIENMNTVLDDNMMLCLSNGQRIKLRWEMRMLFEVNDLAVASPATVSRCGMVYMDHTVIGAENLVRNFMVNNLEGLLPEANFEQIWRAFQMNFVKCTQYIKKTYVEYIATVEANLAFSTVKIIEAILKNGIYKINKDVTDEVRKKAFDKIFLYALVWGVSSSLDPTKLQKFEVFFSALFPPGELPKGSLYDSFLSFDRRTEGEFVPWAEIIPAFEFSKTKTYFELIVPTQDTVRYSWFLKNSVKILRSVFFTGATGTGKTIIAAQALKEMDNDEDNCVNLSMTFSAQTDSKETQLQIESRFNVQRKGGLQILKPNPPGKKLVVLIDDVNMPAVEEYGAQPPIEMLRLFQDRRGFYDREGLNWKECDDTVLICAGAPPGGGRNALTPRFTRHFMMMCLAEASDEALRQIFKSILEGFLVGWQFKPEIIGMSENVVVSTLELYKMVVGNLLPTPSKSHYTFNLRDVSKVFQGILMTKPPKGSTIPTALPQPESMIKIWIHETCRVFYDRLSNDTDRNMFKDNMQKIWYGTLKCEWTVKEVFEENLIVFCDFMRRGLELEERNYEEVKEPNKLKKTIDDYMTEEADKPMNLVLFRDAIEHACRICRILRQLRGHAMLIGLGGSGKKALTKLGAVLAGTNVEMVEPKNDYNSTQFRKDLYEKMFRAVTGKKPLCFLFPDTHMTKESFLEDINNLLNSGEVPNLLDKERLAEINSAMPDVMKRDNVNKETYAYWVEKVRSHLHIVLAMSPVGDKLRNRIRMFASLVNCCTIDWINPWPEDALLSVSEMALKEMDIKILTPERKESLSKMCMYAQITIEKQAERFYKMFKRKVYTTPKGYIDMLSSYGLFLKTKYNETRGYIDKLSNGLTKLKETNTIVVDLKESLVKLQPILDEKTKELEILLKKLDIDNSEAKAKRVLVEADEKEVKGQNEIIAELKRNADNELKKTEPIIKEAEKALGQLTSGSLAPIKKYQTNDKIRFVWECVAILLSYEKQDDSALSKMLADASLIGKMQSCEYDKLPEKIVKKLKSKIASADFSFKPETYLEVQAAAVPVVTWVLSVSTYIEISKEVKIKSEKVAEMSIQLNEANAILKKKQEELKTIQDKVDTLEKQYNDGKAEKEKLDDEIYRTQQRLERADKLTVLLADEQIRWSEKVTELNENIDKLVGDVFVAAASVVYIGPFTLTVRSEIIAEFLTQCKDLNIPCSEGYSLIKILGDPVQTQAWNIQGLPSDSTSVDNAIMVVKTQSWPLMIDPQMQANKWIKNLEKENDLKVIKPTDNPGKRVTECLALGKPILIEDCTESLDASLDPLLTKDFVIVKNIKRVRLEGKEYDYNPRDFRMYFTTKMANPHYLPEAFIRVSIINFTVTQLGLEEQLLADVVKKEMPEIEQQKNELIVSISDNQMRLKEKEDRILELMSTSKGLVLDNEALVRELEQSKKASAIIKEELKKAEETQKSIDAAREKCKPVALRGSILYFVIADLPLVDPMYQFSLVYFSRLFNSTIDVTPQDKDFDVRIKLLIEAITETIYLSICRGLFNSHKQLFSFLVASAIFRNKGQIAAAEWNIFLKGILVTSAAKNIPAIPQNAKINEKAWETLFYSKEQIPALESVFQSILQIPDKWNEWIDASDPFQTDLPEAFGQDKLSLFQKLLLVKILKVEKTLLSMTIYVLKTMGKKFFFTVPPTMDECFKETDWRTPLIFVLSPGVDPFQNLSRFSKERGAPLESISLGQGQGTKAKWFIEEGLKKGFWLLLQNCHLAEEFMPELEEIIDKWENPNPEYKDSFRLFLSSMPAPYFPVSVLQNSVKLTNEPPKGVKANLTRTYNTYDDLKLDECQSKPKVWKKLLFSLSFFHAIIQERRKFGPLGWNIRYEFNESDLDTSTTMLRGLLDANQEIPWDAIRFMTGDINYGGRVTDDWDRKTLNCILRIYCGDHVLADDYAFSRSKIYRSIEEGNVDVYRKYIESLPDLEEPEVFGMHSNANIAFELKESTSALETILSIQPRDVGSDSGKTPDEIALELAAALEQKVPFPIKRETEEKPDKHKTLVPDSLQTCLMQEIERFNRKLVVMRKTLQELQKAIKGEVLMSIQLDAMYQALLNNQVPGLWKKVSYPSLRPLGSWFQDLIERVQFFDSWLNKGKPKGFWLSSFFFPQGFLTSVLQSYARKNKVAIDVLDFSFEFLETDDISKITFHADEGAFIYGLFMEGCRYDYKGHKLDESKPGEMYVNAPIINFIPQEKYEPDKDDYSMPVYKTTTRAGVLSTTGQSTNFVIAVEVPTKMKPEYWTLNGAAFVCQLND